MIGWLNEHCPVSPAERQPAAAPTESAKGVNMASTQGRGAEDSALLITHGRVFTLGAAQRADPGRRSLQRRRYDRRGRGQRGADRPPPGCRTTGCPRQTGHARLDLRPHALLQHLLARHGHPRCAGQQLRGDPGEAVVAAGPGLAAGRRALQRAGPLVDAIRHGCTTLIDHHASPNAIDGSLDIIAETVKQAGLRASLCYEVTDRNGRTAPKPGIAENVRFIKRCAGRARPAAWALPSACTPPSR